MAEDKTLQTQDQFLIEQKIIPDPAEKKGGGEKLKKTTARLARNAAILTLALQHTSVAVNEIDNQAKLREQITFQGLRAYTRIYDMPLSAKFVDRFLYGNGESLDITSDFINIMRVSVEQQDLRMPIEGMTQDMSDSQILEKYVMNSFSEFYLGPEKDNRVLLARTLESDKQGDAIEVYHTIEELPELIGQSVRFFRVERLRSDDTFYGLGDFTVSVEGVLTGLDVAGNAILENPNFSVYDYYDWRRGMDLGVEKSIGDLVEGSSLEEIFPEEIQQIEIGVSDDDGATLIESGIAKPFEITAVHQFEYPITIPTVNLALPSDSQE